MAKIGRGMLGIREKVCYALSKRLIRPPASTHESVQSVREWRDEQLGGQWGFFSEDRIRGKDVLDFGCGFGTLSFYLLRYAPKRIAGVELDDWLLARANERWATLPPEDQARLEFRQGRAEGVPFPEQSFDTVVAFDVMEHVMQPETIVAEWYRLLRPGGKVLAWWSPFRGPYGPHMESLVPIPWAHLVFGERAMFRTAERIYDDPDYVPRPWDHYEDGSRRPNKWKAWSSFKQQGYVNELRVPDLRRIAERVGFAVTRLEPHTFRGSPLRHIVGSALMRMPVVNEYMTSFVILELTRPS